jgi:hypothetical protein
MRQAATPILLSLCVLLGCASKEQPSPLVERRDNNSSFISDDEACRYFKNLGIHALSDSDGILLQIDSAPEPEKLLSYAKRCRIDELHLRGSSITDDGLSNITGMPNLRLLELSQTGITGKGIQHLTRLPKLDSLHLGQTKITDAGVKEFKNLPALKRLFLSDTQITDAGLKELKNLPKLERLDLSKTLITDAGLKHLLEIPTLRICEVDFSKVTLPAQASFERTLADRK